MLRVLCPCGNTLGQVAADHFIMSFRGRRLVVDRTAAVVSVECEGCHETLRVDPRGSAPIAPVLAAPTPIRQDLDALPRVA